MPRVNVDFTNVSDDHLLRALDGVAHDDLQLPETVFQGTSQLKFWRILGEVATANHLTFPLVFLSTCESGPSTFAEAFAIPSSVGQIIHSGLSGMSSEAISYEGMFARQNEAANGFDGARTILAKGLLDAGQGLSIDTPVTAWRWPLLALVSHVPLWILFVPLLVWALWMIILLFKPRHRPSSASESAS
jgi:hypothetical protein